MPDLDLTALVEEAAQAAHDGRCVFHRDGLPLIGHWGVIDTCTEDVSAALAVIVPAITAQIRTLHRHAPHEGAPGWLWCHGCQHSVSADAQWCPTVRLCGELDAAARGE